MDVSIAQLEDAMVETVHSAAKCFLSVNLRLFGESESNYADPEKMNPYLQMVKFRVLNKEWIYSSEGFEGLNGKDKNYSKAS
jgi:hypothetical protein